MRRLEYDGGRPEALLDAPLTRISYARALRALSRRDAALAGILRDLGPPPLWPLRPGFASLLRIILEQQVPLASANATFDRLRGVVSPLTAARLLKVDDVTLRGVGFSRQKRTYARHLAEAVVSGRVELGRLSRMTDPVIRSELTRVKGIGAWTADVYLLRALRRPDAWPVGDLALAVAVQEVKRLRVRPAPADLETIGRRWRPWRAVAARLLWHHYLSARGQGRSPRPASP